MRKDREIYLGVALLLAAAVAGAQPAAGAHLTLVCHIQWHGYSPDPDYNVDVDLQSKIVDGLPAQISEGMIAYDMPIPNDETLLFHVEINRYTGSMAVTARNRDGSQQNWGGHCTRATEPKF